MMTLVKWGTKQSDGTWKDWEILIYETQIAELFYDNLLDRKNIKYVSMETVSDE
tara:strand:+ start:539 stop:700 length:162 start_codon:yes stop_codon:yes gene_type:complete